MFRSLPVFKKIKTSRYQYQIKIIPLLPYSMRTADFRKWRERIWNTNISIGKIEDCINHIIGWYSNNFLLCNSAKTKAIYFSSKFINNDPISSMNIGASTIKLKPAVCDVGVVLDRHVDMSRQVNNICKLASLAIHNIGKIRNYLDQSTAEKHVHAFVTSKIDLCNSLLFGLPKKQFDKLQRVINALNGTAPSYICDLLLVHYPNRNLHSASRGLWLVVPAYQTQAYGARSFSIAAVTLWNSLPVGIKNAHVVFVYF